MAEIPVQDHMVRAFADAADAIRKEYAERMNTFGIPMSGGPGHVHGYLEGVADALRYLVGDLEITADHHLILASVNNRYHEGL